MRELNELPAPPARAVLGHIHDLKKPNVHQQMLAWKDVYGSLYRLRVGTKLALVVADGEIIKKILAARPDTFRRIRSIESVFDEVGLNGVFSSEGERWKIQRGVIERAFLPGAMKGFYPSLQVVTARLGQRFDTLAGTREPVFLVDEFRRYTLEVIASLAFGEDINVIGRGENELSASLRAVFPVLHQRCRSPLPLWRFFKTRQDRAFDAGLNRVKAQLAVFMQRSRQRLQQHDVLAYQPENIMQVMLLEQEKMEQLNDKDIMANALTLLLAGEDTTANTLAWIVYLLCQRPDVEEKLIEELKQCGEGDDAPLAWPVPRMPWLTAVMYEAMRLKPVAPQLYLEPLKDTVVGDVWVKKGTPLFLALHAGGLDERYFNAADHFAPERWIVRDGASFSNMAPFGGGQRLCPGRALAIVEIKMALHVLYRTHWVQAMQSPTAVRERFAFTLSPENFKVTLNRRNGH